MRLRQILISSLLVSCPLGQLSADAVYTQKDRNDLLVGSEFKLRWNKIKLGEMTFSVSAGEMLISRISGRTFGPLRLVKNYDGVATEVFQHRGSTYRLEGINSGFKETREIIFSVDAIPRIETFNEKNSQSGLTPEISWGRDAESPLSLFRRITKSANENSLCSGAHIIYDGKRKYEVFLEQKKLRENTRRSLGLSKLDASKYWLCSVSMKGDSIVVQEGEKKMLDNSTPTARHKKAKTPQQKSRFKWSRVWLFGADDRTLDFVLSEDCGAINLAGFVLSTSFGPVIGRAAQACKNHS